MKTLEIMYLTKDQLNNASKKEKNLKTSIKYTQKP